MDRKLRRAASLTQQATDRIRTRIIRGDFQLGEALSENTLAAELGVSKTPVREALLQLKFDGLVDIQPQRGSFVFRMTAGEVRALSEMREILEVAAARLAIRRRPEALAKRLRLLIDEMEGALAESDHVRYRDIDADFHAAVIDHADNTYLRDAYAGISFRVQALRFRLSLDRTLNDASIAEHRRFLRLVEAGDAEGAAGHLTEHIRGTERHYVATLAAAT